jgi:hypothetical protein
MVVCPISAVATEGANKLLQGILDPVLDDSGEQVDRDSFRRLASLLRRLDQ